MEWICRQEGIEAGPEALAVLAQAGEGSIRDSLSALDQAIACCGTKLDAREVRALLGAFSLDALAQVTQALAESNSSGMLAMVDELERNGHNLQHFSRELARYFRNILVAKISGADTRLIAASADERARLAEIGASFSEEDLTRYLQLTLELFTDLQSSLQPRFHLEIGLLRLVQAGRLTSLEQALADLPGPQRASADPVIAKPAEKATRPPAPAPRTGPSPFELDRAKKAARSEPQSMETTSIGATALAPAPQEVIDWRAQLHAALMELQLPFTADAIEHSSVTQTGNVLEFITPKEYSLAMRPEDIAKAVQHVSQRPFKIKITVGETGSAAAPIAAPAPEADEVSKRALDNLEVQRFREVFGGEVRAVRDLKG
jgi:DNA polymerase-3 subunit gamma/tau